jgi:hypothetical protein
VKQQRPTVVAPVTPAATTAATSRRDTFTAALPIAAKCSNSNPANKGRHAHVV